MNSAGRCIDEPSKVLIDASNLHVGGGVQVGASLIAAFASLGGFAALPPGIDPTEFDILASTEVAANLETAAWEQLPGLREVNSRPGRWASLPRHRYRVAMTIFGPTIRPRRALVEIVGFALPRLIVPPESVGLPRPSIAERLGNALRWASFKRADCLVTETQEAARRISKLHPNLRTEVVPNCVSQLMDTSRTWSIPVDSVEPVNLAVIARDYPHKNLQYLEEIGPRLEARLGRSVTFLVTLTSDEWERRSAQFRKYAKNCGILRQSELADVYLSSHAAVFPSLLEVSSAAPLEAMTLGLPVFVSDTPLFRSAYGNAVSYFDPHDPDRAAETLASSMKPEVLLRKSRSGASWAASLPDPQTRALRYLKILSAAQDRARA